MPKGNQLTAAERAAYRDLARAAAKLRRAQLAARKRRERAKAVQP